MSKKELLPFKKKNSSKIYTTGQLVSTVIHHVMEIGKLSAIIDWFMHWVAGVLKKKMTNIENYRKLSTSIEKYRQVSVNIDKY